MLLQSPPAVKYSRDTVEYSGGVHCVMETQSRSPSVSVCLVV